MNYSETDTGYSWDICYAMFQKINQRQTIALMFHDQMADFFDFLGLNGFKRLHEYQYLAESVEHRKIKRYFINRHNKLLPDTHIDDEPVIPESWFKYDRFDVSPQIRRQSVETAFEKYRAWEMGTKECYEEAAKAMLNMGDMADFNQINCLIWDVTDELKRLDRLILEMKSVGYDDVYIASIQEDLHEKYRCKTKSVGEKLA